MEESGERRRVESGGVKEQRGVRAEESGEQRRVESRAEWRRVESGGE